MGLQRVDTTERLSVSIAAHTWENMEKTKNRAKKPTKETDFPRPARALCSPGRVEVGSFLPQP